MTTLDDSNIPSDFLCPLTLEIMDKPLMNRNGHNFERDAILSWIKSGNSCCPLTRQPLPISGLIRNRILETQIKAWKDKNGYQDDSVTEEESDDDLHPDIVGFLKLPDVPNTLSEHQTRHNRAAVLVQDMRNQRRKRSSWFRVKFNSR